MSTSLFGDSRLPPRFWAKVRVHEATGCWLWTAHVAKDGYGRYSTSSASGQQKQALAHRVAYETLVGPIPVGLHVDHVRARGCSSRSCANPEHLEPVTPRENTLRGDTIPAAHAKKTHCPLGHPYDDTNTYRGQGRRSCRPCGVRRARRYRAKRVEARELVGLLALEVAVHVQSADAEHREHVAELLKRAKAIGAQS